MQTRDIRRLCVRFSRRQTGRTTCQTPYVTADIVSALKANGEDVRVLSVSETAMTLLVNGQEVVVHAKSTDRATTATEEEQATHDRWFSVTANGKAVCLTPSRTETVPTYVTDGHTHVSLGEVLHVLWAQGRMPQTKSELFREVLALHGVRAAHMVTQRVTYVEASSFVEAIRLILEATSEA